MEPANVFQPTATFRLALCLMIIMAIFSLTGGALKDIFAQEKMSILPAATAMEDYTFKLPLTGRADYNYTVLAGRLPDGITFDPKTGELKGKPTADGGYQFKLKITDADQKTGTKWFSLQVNPARPLINSTGREIEITETEGRAEPIPAPTPAPSPAFVLVNTTADEESIALAEEIKPAPMAPDFTADTSKENVKRLKGLIKETVEKDANYCANLKTGDYLFLHYIQWKPLDENQKSEPYRELWALFVAQKDNKNPGNCEWEPRTDPKNPNVFDTRIFGSKRVTVLLVQFNTPSAWDVKYTVTVNRRIPTPVQNVLDLVSNIVGFDSSRASDIKNIWGARLMLLQHLPSDVVVKLNAVTTGPDAPPVQLSKEYNKTYINEGKYRWDVSVGIPVQTIKELQFTSDPNNGNRVTTSAKERQSVYGFLNIYPMPVDLKGDDFLTKPHFLFGVPLASKPLQRPIAGIGTGIFRAPIKFNIFAGVVFIRERVPRTLNVGDVAPESTLESDLRTRWVRKFAFGINFPISQIKNVIKTQ